MAKSRFKVESLDSNGKEKVIFFKLPDTQITKEGQLAYNKAFREALQSGAILRQRLSQLMIDQGLWDDEKEAQYLAVLEEISEKEKKDLHMISNEKKILLESLFHRKVASFKRVEVDGLDQ